MATSGAATGARGKEEAAMNRWDVYEWLKQVYMFSGIVPTRKQVFEKFKNRVPKKEIAEGIVEFVLTAKTAVKLPKRGRRRSS